MMSSSSGRSGVPGVNTVCVLVSSIVSFARGVFVVPEAEVLVEPLVMPADCELLVFLPEPDVLYFIVVNED